VAPDSAEAIASLSSDSVIEKALLQMMEMTRRIDDFVFIT
jgi:hypothetical protein